MKFKFLFLIFLLLVTLTGCKAKPVGQESSSQPATGEERKFVALGASLAKANNLSSTLVGDHQEYSFSTGTKIESVYLSLKNKGENLTPVNLAESGATTATILQRQVPNALGYAPKYLTLDPGADVALSVTLSQFKENLQEIITQLKQNDVIIMTYTYPNFTKMRMAAYPACQENKIGVNLQDLTAERIKSFNQAILDMAEQNKITVVDIYELLGPNEVSDYDCFHPNVSGQQKIASAFINTLNQ